MDELEGYLKKPRYIFKTPQRERMALKDAEYQQNTEKKSESKVEGK